MQGIAGASGKYPCILCQIDRNNMQIKKSNRTLAKKRTTLQMKRNYNAFIFMNKGKGNLKNQRNFYNVIRTRILPVPLNQICLPYLHILLGVVKNTMICLRLNVMDLI